MKPNVDNIRYSGDFETEFSEGTLLRIGSEYHGKYLVVVDTYSMLDNFTYATQFVRDFQGRWNAERYAATLKDDENLCYDAHVFENPMKWDSRGTIDTVMVIPFIVKQFCEIFRHRASLTDMDVKNMALYGNLMYNMYEDEIGRKMRQIAVLVEDRLEYASGIWRYNFKSLDMEIVRELLLLRKMGETSLARHKANMTRDC